jgi:hypothetical protein
MWGRRELGNECGLTDALIDVAWALTQAAVHLDCAGHLDHVEVAALASKGPYNTLQTVIYIAYPMSDTVDCLLRRSAWPVSTAARHPRLPSSFNRTLALQLCWEAGFEAQSEQTPQRRHIKNHSAWWKH